MATLLIDSGPITTITLNRPDVRNAFNEELIGEFTAWAHSVPDDGSVRAAVLQGEGSVFCAGADLNWMSKVVGYSREQNVADVRQAAALYHALDNLPVPLIGRIHGAALGGGAGLAAVCDVVVTTHDTIFGFTEVTLGIVPATISPYVVRKIGLSAARELCLNGARFPAARAKEIGLVHEVVTAGELTETVERHLAQFRLASPSAFSATKRLLREVYGKQPSEVMALTVETIATQRASPDGQEGMKAFLQKRKPSWTAQPDAAKRPETK